MAYVCWMEVESSQHYCRYRAIPFSTNSLPARVPHSVEIQYYFLRLSSPWLKHSENGTIVTILSNFSQLEEHELTCTLTGRKLRLSGTSIIFKRSEFSCGKCFHMLFCRWKYPSWHTDCSFSSLIPLKHGQSQLNLVKSLSSLSNSNRWSLRKLE